MSSAINGLNMQGFGESTAISRQSAAQAYQSRGTAAPEDAGRRQPVTEAPAFEARLSAVPDRSGDPEKQVQTIRQKLYQGTELSDEEMDYIQENDDNLYQKAQAAEDVRRELRASLDSASSTGDAQAIVQQAAKAVAQGMSSQGAITTARESSARQIEAIGGPRPQVPRVETPAQRAGVEQPQPQPQQTQPVQPQPRQTQPTQPQPQQASQQPQQPQQPQSAAASPQQRQQQAPAGSLSATNPPPSTRTAANQAASQQGSALGSRATGTMSEVVAQNAAQAAQGANVGANAALNAEAAQAPASQGPVVNITAPRDARTQNGGAVEQAAGTLSAVTNAFNISSATNANDSPLVDIASELAVSNPTIVNQSTLAAGSTNMTAGSSEIANVASLASQNDLHDGNSATSDVPLVSAAPTIAEEVSRGEIGAGAREVSDAASPAERQAAAQQQRAAARPMAGTGTTAAEQRQEDRNKAIEAQQAMIKEREAAADKRAAQREAQQRSEEKIKRFMQQQETQQNAEPSREVVNARAVRRTWEQFTANQTAVAEREGAMAVGAMNSRIAGQLRSYNRMNEGNM